MSTTTTTPDEWTAHVRRFHLKRPRPAETPEAEPARVETDRLGLRRAWDEAGRLIYARRSNVGLEAEMENPGPYRTRPRWNTAGGAGADEVGE